MTSRLLGVNSSYKPIPNNWHLDPKKHVSIKFGNIFNFHSTTYIWNIGRWGHFIDVLRFMYHVFGSLHNLSIVNYVNWIDVYFWVPNWQYVIVGSVNCLAKKNGQAITWNDDDRDTLCHRASLCSNEIIGGFICANIHICFWISPIPMKSVFNGNMAQSYFYFMWKCNFGNSQYRNMFSCPCKLKTYVSFTNRRR